MTQYISWLKEIFNRRKLMVSPWSVTTHHLHDCVFYICYTPDKGYRAIKLFNDTNDSRIGMYCETSGEAYTYAVCYM